MKNENYMKVVKVYKKGELKSFDDLMIDVVKIERKNKLNKIYEM